MASIRLENVEKVFPGGQRALWPLSLEINDGELVVLVGPSGCGKTTLLRLLAGLEQPTGGRILVDGHDITDQPPRQRDLAMVFQNYALYPHLSVAENLAFGLTLRHTNKTTIEQRVGEAARMLDLEELQSRRPDELSGGQRQRVALGRALVREPRAFLLDEPLSNLDAKLRLQMRDELASLHRRLGTTMLYVTHDQQEALSLGQRIAVLRDGKLQQFGTAQEVYRRPANAFVADFIGTPAINLLRCTFDRDNQRLHGPGFSISLKDASLPAEVMVGLRPQDILLVEQRDADLIAKLTSVQMSAEGGQALEVTVTSADQVLRIVLPRDGAINIGDEIPLRLNREALHFFDATTERRIGDDSMV